MKATLESAELDSIYELLLKLIKNAGDLAMVGFNETTKTVNTKQAYWDLVTDYDKAIENLLIAGIFQQYPNHKWVRNGLS